jgi:hypothetical protein
VLGTPSAMWEYRKSFRHAQDRNLVQTYKLPCSSR